jgi:hypothetical protein
MRENRVSWESGGHREQVLAAIGRWLKEQYDCSQPLPDRLAELLTKIERSPSES